MTKPYGPRSMPAQTGPSEIRWLVSALVAIGIVSSLGLVAVSALLSFRMGYRSADTELDGWIYGGGAALSDALKALAPFMVAYGVKHRDWLAAAAAMLLFVVFTAYSFTAAMGFAAEHRSVKTAQLSAAIETRRDLRRELARQEEELSRLGPQRPSAEVEADRVGLLRQAVGARSRTVAAVSSNCAVNRASTRSTCAAVASLDSELARARQRERSHETIRQLRTALENGGGEGARATPDAQVDTLIRFAAVARQTLTEGQVGFLLSILLAMLVELGSGLGLFVATTPWRQDQRPATPRPGRPEVGAVETFILEHLEPRAGADITITELYIAYTRWCITCGQLACPRREFARQFGLLAGAAGIQASVRNRTTVYRSIGLTS